GCPEVVPDGDERGDREVHHEVDLLEVPARQAVLPRELDLERRPPEVALEDSVLEEEVVVASAARDPGEALERLPCGGKRRGRRGRSATERHVNPGEQGP